MDDMQRKIQEAFNRKLEQTLFGVYLPEQSKLIDTTVSNAAPIENVLTADKLFATIKELEAKDPMLKRGIKRDWLCVINPRIYAALVETDMYKDYISSSWHGIGNISGFMRRQTHIIPAAPDDIMYGPEAIVRQMYPDYFRKHDEYLRTGK